jgi:hypothetical protein
VLPQAAIAAPTTAVIRAHLLQVCISSASSESHQHAHAKRHARGPLPARRRQVGLDGEASAGVGDRSD